MIGFPSGVRVHLAIEPHDMRKSFNGLAAIASVLVERGIRLSSFHSRIPYPLGHTVRDSLPANRQLELSAPLGLITPREVLGGN